MVYLEKGSLPGKSGLPRKQIYGVPGKQVVYLENRWSTWEKGGIPGKQVVYLEKGGLPGKQIYGLPENKWSTWKKGGLPGKG